MKKTFSRLILTALVLINPLHAEFRSWTNAEGTKIDAELVKAEGGNVTLKLRSGKISTFPQSKLSAADQEFIKTAPAPSPAVEQANSPVLDANRKAKWLTKMDKAREESKATGLPILVLFTGTSWCPYCIQLEDEVFSKPDFKTFANQNLVLLILDFGPGGAPNNKKDEKLATDYGVTGYPTYFLTDATGKQLSRGGYREGINPEKFSAWVKSSAPKR